MPDQALADPAVRDPGDDLVGAFPLLVAGDKLHLPAPAVCRVRREVARYVEHDLRPEHRVDGDPDLAHPNAAVVERAPRRPQQERHPDRAVPVRLALCSEREDVRDEEAGGVDLVVVVDLDGGVHPADRGPDRRLGLAQHQRQAVHEAHDVEALGDAEREGDLVGDREGVPAGVVEVDEPDGDVLAAGAEGHRLLAAYPRHELLVGADEAAACHAADDGAEPEDDLISPVGLRSHRRVQPGERARELSLEQHVRGHPRQRRAVRVFPAKLSHPTEHHRLDRAGLIKHPQPSSQELSAGRPQDAAPT